MKRMNGKNWPVLLFSFSIYKIANSDFCGTDSIAYGVEIHHNGALRLLCSKPNCFDKNYSECPERAESENGCPHPDHWVGGLETTIDGKLYVRCCEFEHLAKYSNVRYSEVRLRRGEYFEGEEKENKDGDVTNFDVIKDIREHRDTHGIAYYNLTILSFNCEQLSDSLPNWYQRRQWPYFQYVKYNQI